MNTFKLGLAFWLWLIHPTFVLADSSRVFPDEVLNESCLIDRVSCEASVQIPISIPIQQLCFFDTSLLKSSIDLDIQDIDGDSRLNLNDFSPDLRGANHLFVLRDSIFSFEGVLPLGQHALEVNLTDTCGRMYRRFERFQISNPDSYTAMCRSIVPAFLELVQPPSDINNDGITDFAAARLFPSQFLEEHDFDCSGEKVAVHARFGIVDGVGFGLSLLNDGQGDYIFLNCAYWDWSFFHPSEVELIVTTNQGTEHRCRSSINVVNGGEGWPPCGHFEYTTTSIQVETADGIAIPDVEVKVEGDLNPSRHTTRDGYTSIYNNPWLGEEKTISLNRDSDPGQGVSVTDITVLRQHLLGISILPSPWHLLAADVNNDQRLSLLDILEMQAIILAVKDQFSNNTSWRFFDATTVFENPANPWSGQDFPTSWILPNEGFLNVGFVGVKIGDLNMNALED